ncbi:MAG TPA: efflux RND transporter periplasmic adaptor subunit, partial [Candidatus Polarisedimenticolaceae bacterium]|nr:efflux RND transporter periplasmic adaptor subunit [Candidatus Polarisedimenticolaceae bacterium]
SDTTRAACAAVRAQQQQARARVAVARAELDKTRLSAPISGVVAELNAEVGEVVIPSPPGIPTPPAVDLIEEGCLYVVAPLDEVDAPRVRPGQAARISLDAFPGRSFPGRVRAVAPYVFEREKQARTVDVEVEIERPQEIAELVPGYSADVEVLLGAHDDVLRVPTEALAEQGTVLVLADGRLQSRAITTGLANWQYTEVRSGLVAGERVVLSLDRPGVVAGAAAVGRE